MVMPGFGESYVSARVRVIFALMITLLLLPLLAKTLPALPDSIFILLLLMLEEILIGLFIGSICQILISATHIAGMIISLQAGISSAVVYDPNQSSQGSIIGNLMGILVVVLLFATDLDHLMLRGITESYSVFRPGKFPPLNQMVETVTHLVSDTFTMAVKISAPLIIIGTLLFLAAGIVGRLMPTLQVFAVLTSPQLLIGFFVLITSFSGIMLFYMEFYKDQMLGIMAYLK